MDAPRRVLKTTRPATREPVHDLVVSHTIVCGQTGSGRRADVGWKPNMDLAAVGVSWRLLLVGALVAGKPGKTALHMLPEVKAA